MASKTAPKPFKARIAIQGTSVFMQVIDQPDRTPGEIETDAGLRIEIMFSPELSSRTVYLRGTDDLEDNEIAEIKFPTPVSAQTYYAKLKSALEEYARVSVLPTKVWETIGG